MTRTEGRMIKKSISNSKGFAQLSPESAVLFCMILPHLNAYGKINGGQGYIKDEVCPLVPYLTIKIIPKLLKEISEKTNIKHFKNNERWWIHAINFLKTHQKLDKSRLGQDLLPTYSRVEQENSGLTPPEVEVEDKSKSKGDSNESWYDSLWAIYPKKEGKKEAFKHLLASVVSEEQYQSCRRAVENYKVKIVKEKVEFKYVMHGSTFFNNWKDYENYGGNNGEAKTERPNPFYNNDRF